MDRFELVIAGGGLTAARAIRSYRECGGGGRIVLVSDEHVLPYHRPPLSKRYLRGETTAVPFVEDEPFYVQHDVEVLLGTAVRGVDAGARVLATTDGLLRYEQLLIATGARPRRLRVPGSDGAGVFGLRTVADSAAIRTAAGAAARAVVVGGGFIGMEAAASLRQLGLDVTLIHLGRGLFDQLGSPAVSDELLRLYRAHGVDVLLEEEVAGFEGGARLERVTTRSGRGVEADLAVVGVGVAPNLAFLAGSGVVFGDGVLVSERYETNAPGVYAAGDVAAFLDPLYGRRRRIEHWSNAAYQGAQVGAILAGRAASYDTVSSFFSEIFGLTLKVFGDVSRVGDLTEEGSLGSGFVAHYRERGRLLGAVAVGQTEEVETRLVEAIAAGARQGELVAAGSSR